MTGDTLLPSARPTRLAEVSRDYGLTKEIGSVLRAIFEAADTLDALRESTWSVVDDASDATDRATAHELRATAFRLRSTSLSLARLLDDVSTAAGRLEGLAWAKQALDIEPENEASDDEESES